MILVAIGLLITAAWAWAGWHYVTEYVGQGNLLSMLPEELGLFLIGFMSPLGILWLLISQSATRRRLARLERAVTEMTPSAVRAPAPPGASPGAPPAGAPAPRLEPTIETKGAEAAGRKAEPGIAGPQTERPQTERPQTETPRGAPPRSG